MEGENLINSQLGLKSRSDLRKDDRERDRRVKRLLVLLLLLLLLLFTVVFAYMLFYGSAIRKILRPQGVESLFSIYGFDRPLAVSTDAGGRIYVSDTGHSRFLVFDKNADYIRRIGTDKRPKRIYGVYGSKAEGGKIYIADWSLKSITVFSDAGKLIKRFPSDPLAKNFGTYGFSPFGIDTYKGRLYVSSNDGIYIFTKQGRLLKKWGQNGKEIGSYDYPTGIAVDKKDGSVYVADQLNRRVVGLDPKGNVKWVLGQPDQDGKSNSFFGLPRGIAIDNQRRVFVSDTFHHSLTVLTEEGKLVSVVAKRGVKDGQLNFPEGLTFTSDNILYIADRENDRVQALKINKLPAPGKKILNKYRKFFKKTAG